MADPNEINPNDIASVQEINLDDIAAVDGQPMFKATTPEEIADEKAYNRIQIEGGRFMNALGDEEAIRYEMGAKRHKARISPKPNQERPFNSSEVKIPMEKTDAMLSAAANTATMGYGPLIADMAKSAVRDPASIPSMAANTQNQVMFGLPSTVPVTETRDFYNQASEQQPEAAFVGQFLNPLNYNGMGESAKAIGAGLTKLEQWISNKLGGKALAWVNEYAEKIALRGTNASPEVIQELRKSPSKMGLDSALDDIKYSVVNELQPGVMDDATKTAQKLSDNAQMGRQMKDASAINNYPELPDAPASAIAERTSNLEQIMSPGTQGQISHVPSGGLATTPLGATANTLIDKFAKTKNTALLNSSTSIAKRALEKLQTNMNSATAPFQREETMRKLQALAQMADAEAAAYSYAESMANPVFRQIWIDAQEKVSE